MVRTSSTFARQVWYTLAVLALLAGTFAAYVVSEKAIDTANEQRIHSFLLANELRQSADDLTRMARLFVVTGNDLYAQNFQSILDIREGRKPRPERYDGVYWDLVTGDLDRRPAAAGQCANGFADRIDARSRVHGPGIRSARWRKSSVGRTHANRE